MSDLSIQSEAYDPSTYWTAPAKNFRSSVRLRLQHQLWYSTTGSLLDYRVKTSIKRGEHLKLADLGCGNGAWLINLSEELSNDRFRFQLEGYDINETNFPLPAFLPKSIRLSKLDILSKELPDDITGTFDIVCIRAFSSIIFNNDTKPLLSSVLALLKPGGWVQWEEMGPDFIVKTPSPEQSKGSCEMLAQLMKRGQDTQGMKLDFVREFYQHLDDAGFQDVHVCEHGIPKQHYQGWTENFLMIWEEAASFHPPMTDSNKETVTREFWEQVFTEAVRETEQGVVLHRGCIRTVIGRKPLESSSESLS
ncbi:hypothetical protein F5Y09DRAFT_343416 [Xylaria sp. FL1042]|nr:hypothetical protein F5Y09DRAFT_343416 [Xylaria sp. FL1042]